MKNLFSLNEIPFKPTKMKSVEQVFTSIAAFIMGLMPATGFGFFAYLCYAGISGPGGIVGAVLFILAGLFFWYQIYITASRRGIAEFVSRQDASPDLDNLAPTSNSNYRKLTAREYFDLHQKGELLFKGGSLRIWGDFRERQLETAHLIDRVQLDEPNTLQLLFSSGNRLTIHKPETILESPTYLKILSANSIKWEWFDEQQKRTCYFSYHLQNSRISTYTNSSWESHDMDILLGEPAVVMSQVEE